MVNTNAKNWKRVSLWGLFAVVACLVFTGVTWGQPVAQVTTNHPVVRVVTLPVRAAAVEVRTGVKVATLPVRVAAGTVRTEVRLFHRIRSRIGGCR